MFCKFIKKQFWINWDWASKIFYNFRNLNWNLSFKLKSISRNPDFWETKRISDYFASETIEHIDHRVVRWERDCESLRLTVIQYANQTQHQNQHGRSVSLFVVSLTSFPSEIASREAREEKKNVFGKASNAEHSIQGIVGILAGAGGVGAWSALLPSRQEIEFAISFWAEALKPQIFVSLKVIDVNAPTPHCDRDTTYQLQEGNSSANAKTVPDSRCPTFRQ